MLSMDHLYAHTFTYERKETMVSLSSSNYTIAIHTYWSKRNNSIL